MTRFAAAGLRTPAAEALTWSDKSRLLFTGAMAELAQQWLTGSLGDDLDVVVDHALALVL